jgi:hypothetical protein
VERDTLLLHVLRELLDRPARLELLLHRLLDRIADDVGGVKLLPLMSRLVVRDQPLQKEL